MLSLSLVAAAVLAAPGFGVRLDPGLGIPLSQPQSTYFTPGFHGALTAELALLRFLDVEAQLSYTVLPKTAASPTANAGTMLSIGAGARVRRPLEGASVIPWGEALLNFGFSGGARLPLTFSAGLSFRPVSTLGLLIGAYLRFQQVFSLGGATPGFAAYDASVFSVGLSIEYLSVPSEDQDSDGVLDIDDTCPTEPGASSNRGCPLAPVAADGDGDGLDDEHDRCPREAETKNGVRDDDGCPERDSDSDGVADDDDLCPNAAGSTALKGCADRDGDGVSDKEDLCPDAAGHKENQGCPEYRQLVVTDKKIEIKQKIFFAFGTTKILPRSDPLLDEVALALRDRPQLCVRVEGHTDNKGSSVQNRTLSEGRAQAVQEALVARGTAGSRLSAKGYGDQLPVDDNGTLEGRENNRRVEFVIVPCRE